MKLNRISALILAGVISAGTLLTGCNSINADATLVKTDDGAVTLGYYNFAARYQQAIYDIYYTQYFGDEMWTQDMGGSDGATMEDNVKNSTLDNIRAARLSMAHASEYGVELSDEEKTRISEAADAFMDGNSKKAIREIGATKEYLVQYMTEQYYSLKVEKAFKDAQDITIPDEEANQSTFSYAFLSTEPVSNPETGETEERTDADKEDLLLKAKNIAMSTSATELENKAEEYGVSYNTYSFTTSADPAEDSIGEDVIKAALALDDGETSGVITVEDRGYYVIHMVSKNDSEATESKREQLITTEKNNRYNELLEGWEEATTWEVDENQLKKVKYDRLFEMSKSMQDALEAQLETEE